jgi:cellulose synthase/poly-beta-1,6-N-acetylglucosamine synthase-like glycosyltransferase
VSPKELNAVLAARRPPPSRRHLNVARLVSVLVVVAGGRYLWVRATTIGVSGTFGLAFYAVECLAFGVLVLSALLLARAGGRSAAVRGQAGGTLDVFVTVCGEPAQMVERTLCAALAIEYPHRTYLLNDGFLADMDNWEEIELLAKRYGVRSFMRSAGRRGKAGNLNHALERTDGDFVVTIDADHLATPDLGDETLGYFVDGEVAFVCTSQLFRTTRADVLNNREPLFYRFLQPAKDADSSAFSCGNGTVYRRAALERVGGFSEWNLVEDLHTSYLLHAAGWRSVYHPSPVTIGSAPETASVFLRQRLRWATDSTRLLTRDSPLLKRGLSPMQRLHYLHTTSYYLLAGLQLCFLIGPPLTVFLGIPIFNTQATWSYALAAVPYFATLAVFLAIHGDGRGSLPIVQSALFSAPVYIVAAVRAILGLRPDSRPTEKGRQRWFSALLVPQICLFAALGGTIVYAGFRADDAPAVAVLWASVMAFLLAGPLSAVSARPATERMLCGAIRGGIVLVATLALASQLATRSAAGNASRACGQVPAAPAHSPAPSLNTAASGAYFGISQPDLPVCASAIRRWSSAYSFRPAIVNWFQQWRSGETEFRGDWLRAVARQGAVPMVTWEPWAKPRRGFHEAVQPASRLARIASGGDDAYIRSWARAAARYHDPILLRPMQEMNGTWYPWAVATNGNDAATFVAAWRRIHRIFSEAGADNVHWVWTVHALPGRVKRFSSFYPGDAYVDWVSLTVFNWGTAVGWGNWKNLDQLIAPTYEELAGFHKPIIVSEIGTVTQGGDPAEWVSETMRRLQAAYTQVKAVVWFSYRYSPRADFRLRGRSAVALWAALGSSYWRGGAVLEGRGKAGSGGRSRSGSGSASTSIRSTQSSASK